MPELEEHLKLGWRGFHELHAQRSSSFGPLPISITAIQAWMEFRDVDYDLREIVYEQISHLDMAYLDYMSKNANSSKS